jgi:hydrogenase expression/formation protein HypE
MAVMAAREGPELKVDVESDTACLAPLVEALRDLGGSTVHVLRDPTRGGLAGALNEIALAAGVGMTLQEGEIPVPEAVAAVCEILGLDPLFVANEGVLVAIVGGEAADKALDALRAHPLGRDAARIGTVSDGPLGVVGLRTGLGTTRVVDLLPGDQLPRIC